MTSTTLTTELPRFALSTGQVQFFRSFGFLRLPGLFRAEIDRIVDGFEARFASVDEPVVTHEEVHFSGERLIVPAIVEGGEELGWLVDDHRMVGIADSLLGEHIYLGSDGNLLFCDTSWHCDIYNAPIEIQHLKVFFYLDQLSGPTGALRVIPGTNQYLTTFSESMRGLLQPWQAIEERFGVPPEDVPSHAIECEPGDVIVGDMRTMHATFGGAPRRRLFTMNYRQGSDDSARTHAPPAGFERFDDAPGL